MSFSCTWYPDLAVWGCSKWGSLIDTWKSNLFSSLPWLHSLKPREIFMTDRPCMRSCQFPGNKLPLKSRRWDSCAVAASASASPRLSLSSESNLRFCFLTSLKVVWEFLYHNQIWPPNPLTWSSVIPSPLIHPHRAGDDRGYLWSHRWESWLLSDLIEQSHPWARTRLAWYVGTK